ncbi:MAG: hypothetical protein WBB07_06485 [Mycobacterium sp.]
MNEHQLVVLAGPGRDVPGRIATMLLPLDIEITEMAFTRAPATDGWHAQLTVRTPSGRGVELLDKRLNRLIDVHRVVHLPNDSHRGPRPLVSTLLEETPL